MAVKLLSNKEKKEVAGYLGRIWIIVDHVTNQKPLTPAQVGEIQDLLIVTCEVLELDK
jgi:hypothetical protein